MANYFPEFGLCLFKSFTLAQLNEMANSGKYDELYEPIMEAIELYSTFDKNKFLLDLNKH